MMQPRDVLQGTIVPVEAYHVTSWSPGEAGEGVPPTQVHLILPLSAIDATFVIRLKSAQACDELISALQEHRNFVFGVP